MPGDSTGGGVGKVATRIARPRLPAVGLKLGTGGVLQEIEIAYETYGTLSPARDNAIFICPTLTSDAHAAGHHGRPDEPGWWDEMVGPGKGIDTDHYFVICANILGGCKGTTGPSSLNPATGKPYGPDFPEFTIGDVVDVHKLLVEYLGVGTLAAVIGGSLGGMQVLEWAVRYPDMMRRCICIASATSLSAQALAFDIVARDAIVADPDWQGGAYYGTGRKPDRGLAQARKIGHITYLSPEMMTTKFGRSRWEDAAGADAKTFKTDFKVESYLDHQGRKFLERFDANSYLFITRAMDHYNLFDNHGSPEEALGRIKAKMLIIALSHDWLFPAEQSMEIANSLLGCGKEVSYCRLSAAHGHDAFLVDIRYLGEVVNAFLPWVDAGGAAVEAAGAEPVKPVEAPVEPAQAAGKCRECGGDRCEVMPASAHVEYDIILDMIKPGARVLDLGCGNGELLSRLAAQRQIRGMGVDIDIENVIQVIDKGHDIFQGDIDAGLAMIPDGSYDYAVLSETMQVVKKPRLVLGEMLRVAREGIVSFPNFGKLSHRMLLGLTGRMPTNESLPFPWYDTPNIHLFTLRDFVDLCAEDGISIEHVVCIPSGWVSGVLTRLGMHNAGADRVLVKIARKTEAGRGPGAAPGHRGD